MFSINKHKQIEDAIKKKVINRTTKQYEDYAGKRFVNYTLAYAKRKPKKTGKNITIAKYKKSGVDKKTGREYTMGDDRLMQVDLWLTGRMLSDKEGFYVKINTKPHEIEMFGIKMAVQKLQIKYGFKSREVAKIYEYNAEGRIRKDGKNSARDFLGLYHDAWLMSEGDIRKIIQNAYK